MRKANILILAAVVLIIIGLSTAALAQFPPQGKGPGGPNPDRMKEKRPPMRGAISKEQIKKFEEWLKKEDPDKYKEIQNLKTAQPHLYKRIIFEGIRHFQFLMMMKKKDPKGYALIKKEMGLESKLRKLVRKYRQTSDKSSKKTLKTEMNQILNQLFDVRTSNRTREVNNLGKKVKELRKLLEMRKANKKLIIKQKLEEITGKSRGLEW